MSLMNGGYLASCGQKNRLDGSLTDTIHRINRNFESCITDCLHINRCDNVVQILIQRINLFNISGCFAFIISYFLNFFRFNVRNIIFNVLRLNLVRITSACSKYFNTIVDSRIVACGNHHSIWKFMLHNIEHNKWRR